jgi:DNA repair protein RadD
MTLELRPYQRSAIDATWEWLRNNEGSCVQVIPTGGGKSLIMAAMIMEIVQKWPNERILVVTHVKELVQQNYNELKELWPDAPAGIYSAGLRRRDRHAQILFASIQTVHNKAFELQQANVIFCDEAHLVPQKSDTMYRRFFSDVRTINGHVPVIGMTATPFRLDSGLLTEGEDRLFDGISYEANIRDLINDGYLTPLISQVGQSSINTAGVATRGGEFVAGQLDMAASDPETVEQIASEIVAAGHDRKGWIAFGCGVKHCTMMRDAIRVRGYSCESIFGDTPAAERDAILEAFKRQEIRCLSSMNVLTTGFNAKHVDLVAVARPTKSTCLWIQAVGRGTRLFPGKENCLILDFGSNVERHGCVDRPKIKQGTKGGGGEIPTKTCENCGASCLIAARECPECGQEFEFVGAQVSTQASKLSILSAPPPPPEWLNVSNVSYSLHAKPGKPTSMKARYRCGMTWHASWICFNHTGYARSMAEKFWRESGGLMPFPATTEEALERTDELVQPTRILVRKDGDFTRVDRMDFTPVEPVAEEEPEYDRYAELEGLEF